MTNEVIKLRLPPNLKYLPVLRATTRAIAGGMYFNYDEIIQLRVAVSEAFELAVKHVSGQGRESSVAELIVCFQEVSEGIEILIPNPSNAKGPYHPDDESEQESRALLSSLVDELELGAGDPNRPLIRMVKYKGTQAVDRGT